MKVLTSDKVAVHGSAGLRAVAVGDGPSVLGEEAGGGLGRELVEGAAR